ncbi:class I SAM-dependent methyltransferase [Pseudoduganella namucuonensis]|uniref:Ubiquinone/menaquinone biosynthesis C-methylase UbiE n=1 Tax=Pseudoduganella namucuonensis TaxID=1035707 RepID=A0A1I7IXI6_9BURK|nr:class I SAM-dependent methyltransferase [Pseudoduganella namucuonensis]SFU77646.1 Ubiquinone/menaquinone biosynthesis C-methylase UbiE [Pseudoduganella namucuonensis]
MSANLQLTQPPSEPHVPETAFGKWFLRTNTWTVHVLERALEDLQRLMPHGRTSYPVVADVGCGFGRSLGKLHARYAPQRLIGMDIDPEMLEASAREVAALNIEAEFICCSSSNIALPDDSVDLLFCHQTFHHLIDQERAIAEFHRVLKPGGVLLFAESTRRYIHSWIIRLLFRHPMDVQKTAPEYLALVRAAGFLVPDSAVSYPFLWWSREDLGLLETALGVKPPAEREETLINLVARKPLAAVPLS